MKKKNSKKSKYIKKLTLDQMKDLGGGAPGKTVLCTGGYGGHEGVTKSPSAEKYTKTI